MALPLPNPQITQKAFTAREMQENFDALAMAVSSGTGATWRTIHHGVGATTGATSTTIFTMGTTYSSELQENSTDHLGTTGQASIPGFYFDADDYGATLLRVRAQCLVNDTAPAITYTVGLYPLSNVTGTSGVMVIDYGAVTTGTTVAFAFPAANSENQSVSSEIAVPADGIYGLGFATSGSANASSDVFLMGQVQVQ